MLIALGLSLPVLVAFVTVVLLGPGSDSSSELAQDPGTPVAVAQAPKARPLVGPTDDEFVPPRPTPTPKATRTRPPATRSAQPRPTQTRRPCPFPFLPRWCERNGYSSGR